MLSLMKSQHLAVWQAFIVEEGASKVILSERNAVLICFFRGRGSLNSLILMARIYMK